MNWTCLVYGAPMLAIMIWWVVDAHKWFTGPKVNIEHMMLGREGNLVEGTVVDDKIAGAMVGDGGSSSEAPSLNKEAADRKAGDLA